MKEAAESLAEAALLRAQRHAREAVLRSSFSLQSDTFELMFDRPSNQHVLLQAKQSAALARYAYAPGSDTLKAAF